MSTISWANGKSGKWTDGADWSGGQVPGAGDTAIIDATGAYSVKLSKVVAVGGLVLDDSRAKLVLSGSLTSPDIQLEAGLLELDKGSLSGTVTDGLGTLETAGTGTLASVTWQGNLRDTGSGTLTILDGLTLADASGAGTGTASFTGPVLLDGVAELNNASITFADSRRGDGPVAISNAPTFTIGAQAAISNMFFSVATGDQTFVNDGLVTGGSLGAGGGDLTLTNNGTLLDGSYNATELTNNGTLQNDNGTFLSLTNNGVIDLGTKNALTVFYGQVGAAGANAQINLDSGSLIIAGTLTTAELTEPLKVSWSSEDTKALPIPRSAVASASMAMSSATNPQAHR